MGHALKWTLCTSSGYPPATVRSALLCLGHDTPRCGLLHRPAVSVAIYMAGHSAAETGSPRAFVFSLENAVCKDSYRRQCVNVGSDLRSLLRRQ